MDTNSKSGHAHRLGGYEEDTCFEGALFNPLWYPCTLVSKDGWGHTEEDSLGVLNLQGEKAESRTGERPWAYLETGAFQSC